VTSILVKLDSFFTKNIQYMSYFVLTLKLKGINLLVFWAKLTTLDWSIKIVT